MRGGGEENFISGAGEATQSEAVEFEYPFHMGESHLDFLAFVARVSEGRCLGQGANMIANILIDIARDPARWRLGTASALQRTGSAIWTSRPVIERPAVMHPARGPERLAAGAGVAVMLGVEDEVAA